MSSSKGIGLKAHDLAKILPPQVGRFLFARVGLNHKVILIPSKRRDSGLFDDYQKAAMFTLIRAMKFSQSF